jgi:hypothetical protein
MSSGNAVSQQRSLSLQTVSAIIGAIVGIVTTIFAAGIYYEHLRETLNEYVQKVDDSANAIKNLKSELAATQGSVSALKTFNTNLIHATDKVSPGGTLCKDGQYAVGLRALSESGLEHGAIFQIDIDCRSFGAAGQ